MKYKKGIQKQQTHKSYYINANPVTYTKSREYLNDSNRKIETSTFNALLLGKWHYVKCPNTVRSVYVRFSSQETEVQWIFS